MAVRLEKETLVYLFMNCTGQKSIKIQAHDLKHDLFSSLVHFTHPLHPCTYLAKRSDGKVHQNVPKSIMVPPPSPFLP